MDEPPTRFELLTAAALAWFADEAVDVAVVEVGLGGTVGLHQRGRRRRGGDHQHQLRPHRGARARPSRTSPATSRASSRRAAGWSSGRPTPTLVALLRPGGRGGGGGRGLGAGRRLRLHGQPAGRRRPAGRPPHPGRGLRRAAGAAARRPPGGQRRRAPWPRSRPSSAPPCDEDVVEEAFASVRVPGRLEVVGRHPLVVVDGAHNVAGMMVLARSLVEEFAVEGEAHGGGRHAGGPGPVGHARGPAHRRRPRRWWPAPPTRPRALPAEVVAEAAAALGMEVTRGRLAGRGRAAGRRPGRARRPGAWCAVRSTWWPTPGGCWCADAG